MYRSIKVGEGFSLPELLVSLVIIAAIIGIATDLYLKYSDRSDISEANSRLMNAHLLAKNYFTGARTYVGFCATYPEFSSTFSSKLSFTCSEDRYCFRVRIIGSGTLAGLKSLVSETGPRTISVPSGWTMPVDASRCLVTTPKGDC